MAIYADKKNGKPTGRWRIEVQLDGRRARDRRDSIEEARKREQELLEELQGGGGLLKPDTRQKAPRTLLEALEWAGDKLWGGKAIHQHAISTIRSQAHVLGVNKPLKDLTTEDIDKVVDALSEGRSGSTVNRHLSPLHRLLKWCNQRGYIDTLPIFDWQEENEGRIRWLTREEEHQLLSLLEICGADDVADFVRVAIATGMRRGEILTLEPEQIDHGWVRLWKTKTSTPRSVAIVPAIEAILRKRVPWSLKEHRLRYFWSKCQTLMGLEEDPWFVVHCLRHTTATRLVQAGVNLAIVQKYLGHKRIETTLRYAHVHDESLQSAAKLLQGLTEEPQP